MNQLENSMNQLIEYINTNRIGFGFKNNPDRNHKGVYICGEPFDYTIFNKNGCYCFDCKETVANHWVILDKDIIQGHNLLQVNKFGANSFFLIYFKKTKEIYKLQIKKFVEILENGGKTVFKKDMIKFNREELIVK